MSTSQSQSEQQIAYVRDMLNDIVQRARSAVGKVDDARLKAIFETTSEVVGGLIKTYDDYQKHEEEAFRST